MKFKLSIIIFTIILLVFYLQTVSCKNKPQEPEAVYSNYTGYLLEVYPSIYDSVKYKYMMLTVKQRVEEYYIMDQSDIDKLKSYLPTIPSITIKTTYSNSYYGKRRGYNDNYLFDVSVVE